MSSVTWMKPDSIWKSGCYWCMRAVFDMIWSCLDMFGCLPFFGSLKMPNHIHLILTLGSSRLAMLGATWNHTNSGAEVLPDADPWMFDLKTPRLVARDGFCLRMGYSTSMIEANLMGKIMINRGIFGFQVLRRPQMQQMYCSYWSYCSTTYVQGFFCLFQLAG